MGEGCRRMGYVGPVLFPVLFFPALAALSGWHPVAVLLLVSCVLALTSPFVALFLEDHPRLFKGYLATAFIGIAYVIGFVALAIYYWTVKNPEFCALLIATIVGIVLYIVVKVLQAQAQPTRNIIYWMLEGIRGIKEDDRIVRSKIKSHQGLL